MSNDDRRSAREPPSCVGRILVGFFASMIAEASPVYVRGYFRRNGTYVAPYVRTSPNSTKDDNWSTKGNVNPYTGKAGTKSGNAGWAVRLPQSPGEGGPVRK